MTCLIFVHDVAYMYILVHVIYMHVQNSQDILSENKDAYMINPCSAGIWFIVELCELVSVRSLEIASFELFSSTPKSFKVYASERYMYTYMYCKPHEAKINFGRDSLILMSLTIPYRTTNFRNLCSDLFSINISW